MTDVEYSPNGAFFVVSTTAALAVASSSANGGNGCDVVARFESNGTSRSHTATWTAYTGGDTTWTVEVTDNVVYAGGHQSWQNNPIGANVANQGAVCRDPASPDSTPSTECRTPGTRPAPAGSGSRTCSRPARASGSAPTPTGSASLRVPRQHRAAPPRGRQDAAGDEQPGAARDDLLRQQRRFTAEPAEFNGTTATTPTHRRTAPSVSWGSTVGAFMSNGTLYTAASNGQVTKRTFDGSTYGAPSVVNTADQLAVQTDWHNTDVPSLTSLFFYNGEMFFTRSGQTTMFRRGFEPESDIVGQQRFPIAAVSGINFSSIRGAFVANDKFYYSNTTGQLFRADWSGPLAGRRHVGAGLRAGQGQPELGLAHDVRLRRAWPARRRTSPPRPQRSFTCTGLTCTFNGTASTTRTDTLTTPGTSATGRPAPAPPPPTPTPAQGRAP